MQFLDNKKIYIQFGAFVRQGREKKQLFQTEVAQRVGVSQAYYSQIENGSRQIPMVLAINICMALDLNFNDFINSLNKKKARVNRPEIENSPPL